MTIKRLDSIGIGVDDMDTAISFFKELGLELEERSLRLSNLPTAPTQPMTCAAARSTTGAANLEIPCDR